MMQMQSGSLRRRPLSEARFGGDCVRTRVSAANASGDALLANEARFDVRRKNGRADVLSARDRAA